MESNQNRILLIVVVIIVVVGGITIWRQREAKSLKPVIGWHEMGTEEFDLKPNGNHGFSYREIPAKVRIELHSSAPVAFGFVTPEIFGRYTSTILPLDFASLPCGNASTTGVDLNCATQPDKRYLLVADTREDAVPEAKKGHAKADSSPQQPDNHVSMKMYEWRCIEHCENLPPGAAQ